MKCDGRRFEGERMTDVDRLNVTLPDGRTLRMCFACGVNEHENCAKDPAICDGCAVCLSGPWSCGRCGDRFRTEDEAQRHADACTNPTMRLT